MNKFLLNLEKTLLIFIIFFGVSLLVYFFLNAGAFAQNLWYTFYFDSPFLTDSLREERLLEFTETALLDQKQEAGEKRTALAAEPKKYQLIIPKISVNVPIVIPEGQTDKDVLKGMEGGVSLYTGSSLPGEEGKAVILGHSSRATWYHGNYAYIFSLLPRLEIGEEFYITADGEKHTYRIFSKKFLSPAKTNELLAGRSNGSEVNLITCYPIGGASQRTIIQAQLVS